MENKTNEKLHYFRDTLNASLGNNVKKVVLFGSRARNESHEGSDFDFLIILKNKTGEDINTIRDIEVDFLDRFDQLCSSIVYEEAEWKERSNLPLYINIEREGVPL